MNGELDLELSQHRRETAARSRIYQVLSCVFTYPADERQKDFVLRGAGLALREAIDELPFGVPAIESLGTDVPLATAPVDIQETYIGLFDNCAGRATLSLYEKDYSKTDTNELWEEVIRFYERFGLNYGLKECKEWPDYIGMQLEFLHYLTFLEAGAPDDAVDVYVAAESDFLERHVARWIPKFSEKLRARAGDTYYGALAAVLAQFVEGEAEFNRRRRKNSANLR